MTRLVLVRHAQSVPSGDLAPTDWPLTETGRAQAVALAPTLAELGVEALVSSPYRRAIDTLAPFAETASLAIAVDRDLRERELGGWIEKAEDVEAAIARTHADPDFTLKGGESARVSLARFEAALRRVAEAQGGRTIAVGSHGGILSYLIARQGRPLPPCFWRAIRSPHVLVFDAQLRWTGERTLNGAPGLWAS